MKVGVLADTHFGVRGDSKIFLDNMEDFLLLHFFPEMERQKIKHIIHAGDLVDKRKNVNFTTIEWIERVFIQPIVDLGIELHIIPGNHDLPYRETTESDACTQLLKHYENIRVYNKPTRIGIDNILIDMIPWINKANREEVMDFIAKSRTTVCFGHFEFAGFQMYRGQIANHGDDAEAYQKYSRVFSGHYHHRSTQGNISYLGSPTQHTWNDYGDVRGYHIFDTDTAEMEFIPVEETTLFHFIDFHEDDKAALKNVAWAKNKFIRVRYHKIEKQSKLDNYLKALEDAGAHQVTGVPIHSEVKVNNLSTEVQVEDTLSLIKSLIDDNDLYNELARLYTEASVLL